MSSQGAKKVDIMPHTPAARTIQAAIDLLVEADVPLSKGDFWP